MRLSLFGVCKVVAAVSKPCASVSTNEVPFTGSEEERGSDVVEYGTWQLDGTGEVSMVCTETAYDWGEYKGVSRALRVGNMGLAGRTHFQLGVGRARV